MGTEGILPVGEHLDHYKAIYGNQAPWHIPTIFWFTASDRALTWACLAGMAASLLVLLNLFARTGLLLCYVLYLSLVEAGQIFTSYQWDMFLLESGFLALFLVSGSPIAIWLYRFLLFRFMFMGGVVKLASGDPSWRHLAALNYHFETQPLPSPLAWYAHHIPEPVLQVATAAVFLIELVVPFFVFLPRPFRLFAAVNFILLQGSILLTGNYNFFNLLTSALCIFLLEDRDLRPLLGTRLSARILGNVRPPAVLAHMGAGIMGIFTVLVCGSLLWMTNMQQRPIQPFYQLAKIASTLSIINGYGPFAVMTTERREIVIEGSDDNENWLAYEFKYKPGELTKPLTWNIPHQPRLDWQMWFAALSDTGRNPWFPNFMDKLQTGSAPVLSLLQDNPFQKHPPQYLRASFYLYRFTTPEERASNGQIWRRERLGVYPGSVGQSGQDLKESLQKSFDKRDER